MDRLAIFEKYDSKVLGFVLDICPPPNPAVGLNLFSYWIINRGLHPLVSDSTAVDPLFRILIILRGLQ